MNKEPLLLSILVPTIPSRFAMAERLVKSIEEQIGDLPVELLYLGDNKRRSVGLKRDALIQLAQARFLCFADDDDFLHPNFCSEIVAAIRSNPDVDVVVFNQHATINGKKFTVRFGLEYENEQAQMGPDGEYYDIKRPPYHICAWRSALAQKYRAPDRSYGEDWIWIQQLLTEAKTQTRIEAILHTYRYDDRISEAKDPPKPEYNVIDPVQDENAPSVGAETESDV